MIPVVTAVNRAYFPALRVLSNSVKANAPGTDVFCICGHDLSDDVGALGVIPIPQPDWRVTYPVTSRWPKAEAAMYSRLLIPGMFDEAIWIDADCAVMKPLDELADLRFKEPVAAVHINTENYTLGFHVGGVDPKIAKTPVPFTGLMVFNCPVWRDLRITERCAELMNAGAFDFRFVVQSVLGLVLEGNYHRLPERWQIFAGRAAPIPADARILHWVGCQPWVTPANNQNIWEQYA